MKKSIASLAMLASAFSATTSSAMIAPPNPNAPKPVIKTICMNVYANTDRSVNLGGCDQSYNNATLNKALLQNGCAEGQVALTSIDNDIKIDACMPPGMAQL